MFLVSNTTKQVIMWELTVSSEETMAGLTRYQELVEQCMMKGGQSHSDPIEIGCRGFVG